MFWTTFRLMQQFSTWGDFAPQGPFGNIWRLLLFATMRAGACYCPSWVEGRDAAEHPAMTAPTKDLLAQNVNSVKLKNLGLIECYLIFDCGMMSVFEIFIKMYKH